MYICKSVGHGKLSVKFMLIFLDLDFFFYINNKSASVRIEYPQRPILIAELGCWVLRIQTGLSI